MDHTSLFRPVQWQRMALKPQQTHAPGLRARQNALNDGWLLRQLTHHQACRAQLRVAGIEAASSRRQTAIERLPYC